MARASEYRAKAYDAITQAGSFDADDYFTFGANYFVCGWGKESHYNHAFSISIALIGSLYGDEMPGRSDYHRGVAFMASQLGVKKRQIKVLRKKMKYKSGFAFKTPYNIAITIKKMIELLRKQEQNLNVQSFLSEQESDMYREILIKQQFEAIKEAAKNGNRKKVKGGANDLRGVTTMVGE